MSLGAYLANLEGPVESTYVDAPVANGRRERIRVQLPKVSKIEMEKSLNIADGATTIVRLGKKASETRNAPPIVSKVPYLNRLFTNAAYGETNLFLLVTPRIIIHEEEEELFQAQN